MKTGALSSRRKAQAGFTLVEIAVVLIIVGVLAGLGISAIGALRQTAGASNTVKKQETLKTALIAYLRNYRRLPCPDTNFSAPDGIENRTATTGTPPVPDVTSACAQDAGVVPYVTLGLPREAAVDGYDNLFSYFVSNVIVGTNLPNRDWTISADPATGVRGLTPGNVGSIQVTGEGGQALTNVAAPETLVVVAIVSHGANGLGARTLKGTINVAPAAGTDEADNAGGAASTTLHQRQPTDNAAATGGAYDDVVMVLRPADLLSPLFGDGSMKPAIAQTQDNLNAVRDYVVSAIALSGPSACAVLSSIAGLPPAARVDGWGNALAYSPIGSSVLFTLSASNPTSTPATQVFPSGTVSGSVLKSSYPAIDAAC